MLYGVVCLLQVRLARETWRWECPLETKDSFALPLMQMLLLLLLEVLGVLLPWSRVRES
jgi:hypothetical protein